MAGITIENRPKPKWIDLSEGECEAGYLREMGSKVIEELNRKGMAARAKAEYDENSGVLVNDTRLIEVRGISNMMREYKFDIELKMNHKAYRNDPEFPFSYDMKKRLEPFAAVIKTEAGGMNSDLAQNIVRTVGMVFASNNAGIIVTTVEEKGRLRV
jgi:hypothetical protein